MINGRPLDEPHPANGPVNPKFPTARGRAGEIFVSGDNRPSSDDSLKL